MSRFDVEYVLPLHRSDGADAGDLGDLARYLRRLSRLLDVTVVDSSPPHQFEIHALAFGPTVRHLRPDPWPGRNGKVRNVMTGIRVARHEQVVLADDDVRYDANALARAVAVLHEADVVVPQNVFTEWPWHARWDTARQLINRAFGGDYPGTLLVRRSRLAAHGYDGDVLFENLQLIRTVAADGGTVHRAPDLYVGRRPPTWRHFRSQRVRQAYDDFAQPTRLIAEAILLPTVTALCLRAGLKPAALLAAVSAALAETGRRRGGGSQVFPRTASLWAPLWVAERAVCVWLAIGLRFTGGVRYGEHRIRHAATAPARRSVLRAPAAGAPNLPVHRIVDEPRAGAGHPTTVDRVADRELT